MGAMKVVDPAAWTYAEDAPYAWRVLKSVPIDAEAFRSDCELAQAIDVSCRDAIDPGVPLVRSAISDVAIVAAPDAGQGVRALIFSDGWPKVGAGSAIYRMLLRASGVVPLDRSLRVFARIGLERELGEYMADDPGRDPRSVTWDLSVLSLVRMIDEVRSGVVGSWSTKSRLWHHAYMTFAFTGRRARWDEALALMRVLTTPSEERVQEEIGLRILGIGRG